MSGLSFARFTDSDGKLPLPPEPIVALMEDGDLICTYSLNELEDLALAELRRQMTD